MHTFVRINSKGAPIPARPPKPARTAMAAAAATVPFGFRNAANSSGHSATPTLTTNASNDPWLLDGRQTAATNSQFPGPSYLVQP